LIEAISVMGYSGFLSPSFLKSMGPAAKAYGSTSAAGFTAAAARNPTGIAVKDERGDLTFGDLDKSTNAIARALAEAGVKPGHGVGLFARNHRGFVQAQMALDKLGANTLLLNTGFAAPQLKEVSEREGTAVILYDEEFRGIVEEGASDHTRFCTWAEGDAPEPTLDELVAGYSDTPLDPPASHGRVTVLTSGTTGTPKGAQRGSRRPGVDTFVGLFGRMPLRTGTTNLIVAPTFHSWGGFHLIIGAQLGCTVVLQRRFDPESTLKAIDHYRPQVLAVVPVMMQRASIAMPDELRAAPGTAGRPPRGVVVKILDENGKEVPTGQTGRIFVANENQFDGYTGGGNKEVVGGLMSSGDVGHFDENGLLFVDGRDDDMIVSGGENVFPREVEDLLADREDILEASVIGVPDKEFGQRLRGFVVKKEGANVEEAELKDYVKQNLARYKVPRDIVFLDELPRNPTGKVLKRVLAEYD
jgi:fatty-acyl-CoA synthase